MAEGILPPAEPPDETIAGIRFTRPIPFTTDDLKRMEEVAQVVGALRYVSKQSDPEDEEWIVTMRNLTEIADRLSWEFVWDIEGRTKEE
jgi:hypothetical protein